MSSTTYQTLATLRGKLTTTKQKERRAASKELLELLSNPATLRALHLEAQSTPNDKIYPAERVQILLRNLLEASLLASQHCLTETKRKTSNGTGYIKQTVKFTAEDVLFPQRVFLKVDNALESYNGYNASVDEDWKHKPRYCFHIDPTASQGTYSATSYPQPLDSRENKTNLSSKEILGSVSYIISCLNNTDCRDLAEVELMQWLSHICARVDYVACLPFHSELSYILHEISTRIYAEGSRQRRSLFVGMHTSSNSAQVRQECLVACAKCLSGLVYNTTTRLGMGMQIYLRPIVELVAWYANHAWTYQSGGGLLSSGTSKGQVSRTEMDIVSLLPHLYSAVTHLLAAHPEQAVAVVSEHGHALLRLAKKNYLKSASDPLLRDALTEYFGAHLLVAETSGKLYGLPEGDVGPLVMESSGDDDENKVVLGATLDMKAVDNLLQIVGDEKVWEAQFANVEQQDAKSKPYQRNRFRTQKKKRDKAMSAEGGGKWTLLNKRQRRYLELVARLLRLSQRLHLAEAEALGDGSSDAIEDLKLEAEEMMMQKSDIENGEIGRDTGTASSNVAFNKQLASDEALAETPFVSLVCQHLYKLNPKLENAAICQDANDTSMTQPTVHATQVHTQFGGESLAVKDNTTTSFEQNLLKSCPLLRALLPKHAASTQTTSLSTIATLQLICASAEAYPRGECWSSSARQNWSTTLDENIYPGGASARVRERHGSSPADAATVVYLLGTTLESCGGSGGDNDVQVWTLVALLKMTESSAIISTREGVPMQSLEALRLAWKYVWKTLLRYDLRYSSYTAGAYTNNCGELVLQLLTQVIRYQCTNKRMEGHTLALPLIQALELPIFEKPTSILTGACFELVTALMQFTEIPVNTQAPMTLSDISDVSDKIRDRRWLVSFCLTFIENSLGDNIDANVQRSFLPFVATCLASLLSDGNIVEKASTYELDSLTRFSVTEDTDYVVIKRSDLDALRYDASINIVHDILWRKILFPYIHPSDCSLRLEQRIMQGRGVMLNQFSDANQEREKLSATRCINIDSAPSVHTHHNLGVMAFAKINTLFDEIHFGLLYGSDNEDESEGGNATYNQKNTSDTPRITCCLSLLISVVLSSRVTIKDISECIVEIAPETIVRVFDHLTEVLDASVLQPADVLSVINHIDGIVRVLSHVEATSDETTKIPSLINDQLRAIFSTCTSILRNYRQFMYTSSNTAAHRTTTHNRRPIYESDDDLFESARKSTQRLQHQFSDDSDGFMDDAEAAAPVRVGIRAPPKLSAPPPKRQRTEKINPKRGTSPTAKSIDSQGAWSCASLMILLNPSIECLEIITGHLVWPEDYDSENGYAPVCKDLNPFDAIVCLSLFCKRKVIMREHLLRSNPEVNKQNDGQSAIVLCIEIILQARRHLPPSSKYFMYGLGFLSELVELDRTETCPPISAEESKFIINALYPEGMSQDNEDYRQMRQLRKVLKVRNQYRVEQLHTSIGIFLLGKDSVHNALDSIFSDYFIKSSFRHIDEVIRSKANDALGVALGGFPDQQMIVSEMNRSILPPLKSERKFTKWMNSMADPKTPVDLSPLEQAALADARLSFEFHAIDCIGLIAGSTTEEDVCIDMVWKLVDLTAFEPAMGLLCRRACERTAMMLGFSNVRDLLSDMIPHLLVKWIESRRSLGDFPLLMSSPYALQNSCRYLPSQVLDLLISDGGWDDKFLNADTSNYVQSCGDFLVPTILLIKSDQASDDEVDAIDGVQYLSEYVTITMRSTSDETFAKVLRHHISDIFGYHLLLIEQDKTLIHEISNKAIKHLQGRISDAHIQRDGAKQAFMILRRILKLHALGVSVVGQQVHLTNKHFIEGKCIFSFPSNKHDGFCSHIFYHLGMKSVSKNIGESSECNFFNSIGSSMTELLIVSGYWLTSNGISLRQREKFWKPIKLLCSILQSQVQNSSISPHELSFCISFFISTALNPKNHTICPYILYSLNDILKTLFYYTKDKTLVDVIVPTIHKLCLALLTVHKNGFRRFFIECNSSMADVSYNKKCSIGVLHKLKNDRTLICDDGNNVITYDDLLKQVITTRMNDSGKTESDIMIGAYDCLDTIVNSGKISLDDILGAEDAVNQVEAARRRAFGDVHEKYECEHLFNKNECQERGLLGECAQFMQIMEQYPITDTDHQSSLSHQVNSVDALARLLALKRLEKSMAVSKCSIQDEIIVPYKLFEDLIHILQSNDSNDAKTISSVCLGRLSLICTPVSKVCEDTTIETNTSDPLEIMKSKVLSLLGQCIISGSPDISLIAMKSAKLLLSTKDGIESWNLLNDEIKGVLKPFLSVTSKEAKSNGGIPQKEQVLLSNNYVNQLKLMSGNKNGLNEASWCWNDGLWTTSFSHDDGNSVRDDCWIQNIVSAIIVCCFGKDSRAIQKNSFIRMCQGMSMREASFAKCMFPGIIYTLLEAENDDRSVRDKVLVGSPTSEMNVVISHCFARILNCCDAVEDPSYVSNALRVVLDTLLTLHSVTLQRFLSSRSHKKNSQPLPKEYSNKKSRKSSDTKALHNIPTAPKWRGVPFGIVLRLEGLEVARACLKSKQYYSAIYFCEMSMQNYCGVGNFLEQIATDVISNAPQIGDISGFGIVENEHKKSLIEMALEAKDILASCLTELQQNDELHGVLSQASALSLKQSMTTLNPLHENQCDETFSMLLDLDIDLQSRNSAVSDVNKVSTYLEDLGLDHVKHHYLKGISSGSNLHFNDKWFEDALLKTSLWDDSLLAPPHDNALTTVSSQGVTNAATTTTFATELPTSCLTQMPSYNEAVYYALQSFSKEDFKGGYSAINQARDTVLYDISLLKGSESKLTSMASHLTKLNICSSLTCVGETMEGKISLDDIFKHWGFMDETGVKDFTSLLLSLDETALDIGEHSKSIDSHIFQSLRLDYSVKEVLVALLLKTNPTSRDSIIQVMSAHIHKSYRMYRDLGRPDVAKQSLSRLRTVLQSFGNSPSLVPVALRLEDAKVMARQLDLCNAITHCKTIVNHLSCETSNDTGCNILLAQAHLLGGCLMAHEHVDAVGATESYFERATKLAHQIHKQDSKSSGLCPTVAYFKLGEFASSIYASIDARSETWNQRKTNLSAREKESAAMNAELEQLTKKAKKSKKDADKDAIHALHRKVMECSKEIDMETREIQNNQDGLQKYLIVALDSYCNALKLCPTFTSLDYSKHVFKLIGLWFKNCQMSETQDMVNSLIQSSLKQIPTYHFVPLTYQIFSRIGNVDDKFQNALQELVIGICSEHPYHGIPQLIALENGNLVDKVEAAKSIIERVRKHAPEFVSGLIDTYSCLMNAYIDLALLDTTDIKQTKGLSFSKYKLKLDVCLSGNRRGAKHISLENAPAIISKPPPIRPDAQYGNGIEDPVGTERVVGFEPTFDLAPSGIHRPAIIMCLGSQGGRFKQLVKGEDDMRQDAVMQQVFGTLNNLLGNEGTGGAHFIHKLAEKQRQKLKVITYGIAPLSPRAGVLEWVEGTVTFGHFFSDSSNSVGAPSRYYPGEWSSSACRELYGRDEHYAKNQQQRRRDFDIICRMTSPVFRFFFIENFASSMEAWYTARTAYTRSCAVNSIVGHILGIGDRHTSNILIHTKTGELVHIDFGYVFEQAKLLNTPETVPFRLTRNVIDGMGVCGTDGVYSKSAEATLSVLRKHSDTVLTILSAIVSDTLDRWSRSSSKSENDANDAAERAMSKVHDKLQGYEDGTTGMHNVAGQVKYLINEARDPNNLCNLFAGWQPWI